MALDRAIRKMPTFFPGDIPWFLWGIIFLRQIQLFAIFSILVRSEPVCAALAPMEFYDNRKIMLFMLDTSLAGTPGTPKFFV